MIIIRDDSNRQRSCDASPVIGGVNNYSVGSAISRTSRGRNKVSSSQGRECLEEGGRDGVSVLSGELSVESAAGVIAVAAEDHLQVAADVGAGGNVSHSDLEHLGDDCEVGVEDELLELGGADAVAGTVDLETDEVGLAGLIDLEDQVEHVREGGGSGRATEEAVADDGALVLELHGVLNQLLGLEDQEDGRADALDVRTAGELLGGAGAGAESRGGIVASSRTGHEVRAEHLRELRAEHTGLAAESLGQRSGA